VATVVQLDMTTFGARLKKLAADLSHPESSLASIRSEFAEVGKLLLGPAALLLEDKTSLVVLPDGFLNLVPFELLVHPETGATLFDDRVVRTAISLRHAINLQERTGAGQGESLFAVADPIYQSTYEVEGLSTEETTAAARGSDYLRYFSQLPETRTEVQTIARLFPEASVSLLLGREASESTVKAMDLGSYRFVHMATHGILGGEVPGVAEPALVLSEEPDQDGFLTASEASELSLDAELTVLSACKTGSGEYVTGEGVMGMSRAFIVGGSRNVLVSLWAVDSLATESLMVKFYRFLRGGMAAPQALREAKMSLIAEYLQREGMPQTDVHPFYWAAFVLIGS
jgi:CHAT domain-containing protein